jgi:hypothetical protein
MSLEESILKLVAALEANTAAIGLVPASGGKTTSAAAPAPADKPKADKPKAAAYEAKHSHEEMAAALGEVKEKFGAPAAKAIISEVGGKAKMAEITDAKVIDAVYDAAKAKLEDEGM